LAEQSDFFVKSRGQLQKGDGQPLPKSLLGKKEVPPLPLERKARRKGVLLTVGREVPMKASIIGA